MEGSKTSSLSEDLMVGEKQDKNSRICL
uniref:Uncharacterized protein n=1 Tax=Rhizophora mucronata TaxID=61149 RepID=A0A2P2J4T3_RHIMU